MAVTRRPSTQTDKRLRWPLRLTWAGLLAERAVQAFWPVWTAILTVLAAILFGVAEQLQIELLWGLIVVAAAALLGTLWFGLRRFAFPSWEAARDRLDKTIPGRPIAALADRQAVGADDPASRQVWAAHRARMRARLAAARAVDPDLRLARFDRYGLRYLALTLVVMALMFGSFLRLGDLGGIVPGGSGATSSGPSWEGWIEPPRYTGKPTLYLGDLPAGHIEVPIGSRISLRLYGGLGDLTVAETVSARVGTVESATNPEQGFIVQQDGSIEIRGEGGRSWTVDALADDAPKVGLDGDLSSSAAGEMTQPYRASDDYGIAAGHAIIALDQERVTRRHGLQAAPEPRDSITVDLPMPMSGERASFQEVLIEDFSKHPWVGLPVTITLVVVDEAGGEGRSPSTPLSALPGRRFFDPLANALIEQRRDLLWTRENGPRVAQLLRAVSADPDGFFRVPTDYMMLRMIARSLEFAGPGRVSPAVRDEAAEALWQIALRIEEGDLSDALERLRQAEERLSEAMKNGASEAEIAQLMQEMRDAMQDYMRQLAEQSEGQERQLSDNENMQEMTSDQLQQMLDDIQRLMEEGRMAEAQALLDQLSRMMENMQVTQGQPGGPGGPGQQAMQGLAETLRDQQELSDDSFQGFQDQFGDGQQPGGRGSGEGLADRQQALEDTLRRQRDGLPGSGEEGEAARRALDEAGRAMGEAEEALRRDDLAGALDSQSDAMDSLREGMQALGEDMARQQMPGPGQDGQANGGPQPGMRDPLGRQAGNEGRLGTDDSLLPGNDEYGRARDLLDEIRRRSGDQQRPDIELDYLRRLLDRF